MKKHISVLSLYLRMAFPWLLITLLLMAVGQIVAFCVMDLRSARYFYSEMTELQIGFVAGCVAIYCVCIGNSEKHSRFSYTLRRLRISEWKVFLWNSAANCLIFLILWFWEILIVFFLSQLFASSPTYHHGTQGILAAFYRSTFYHGLFPLEEIGVWIRNVVLCVVLGIACAYGSLLMRQRRKMVLPVALPAFVMQVFSFRTGEGNLNVAIPGSMMVVFGLFMLTTAHDLCRSGEGGRQV